MIFVKSKKNSSLQYIYLASSFNYSSVTQASEFNLMLQNYLNFYKNNHYLHIYHMRYILLFLYRFLSLSTFPCVLFCFVWMLICSHGIKLCTKPHSGIFFSLCFVLYKYSFVHTNMKHIYHTLDKNLILALGYGEFYVA